MTIQPQQNFPIPSAQAGKQPATAPATQPTAAQGVAGETLATPNLESLRAAMGAEPELRPSQVARALVWAKDPNYPPLDALNNIASRVLSETIRNL